MNVTLIETSSPSTEERFVATIVTAFAADPAARWLYPDPHQYLAYFPGFIRAFAGKSFECDTADEVDGFAGAALWLPPGVQPDETPVVEVLQHSVAEQQLPEVFRVLEQMGSFHPTEPHWYLPLIGVDPCKQGQGVGAALMRRALARCDRDICPVYLEATHPRNVSFYERFGFKRLGRIRSGNSPEIIPMLRSSE